MFSIEINNHVVVQLKFASNTAEVQERLHDTFEEVILDFTCRDVYHRASIDAAAQGTLLLEATLDKHHRRPFYHLMYAAAAIEGRSRASAGEQTARYFQYRSAAHTAAHAATV